MSHARITAVLAGTFLLAGFLLLTACGGSEPDTDTTQTQETIPTRHVDAIRIKPRGDDGYWGVIAFCDGTTRVYQTRQDTTAVANSPECRP